MLHQRKANLIQLGFEKDLTQIFRNEGKDIVLRRFHTVANLLKVVKPLCIFLSHTHRYTNLGHL